MRLKQRDYLLTALSQRLAPLLRQCGDLESSLVRRQLTMRPIDQPVFICGLARSGTTLLLNLLARVPGVATHRYGDFPFLWIPLAWHWLQGRTARATEAVERPHRDRIYITRESPEAFEEPLWQFFFPWLHNETASHILDDTVEATDFATFFVDHIRKVLLLRGGARYVSKGNYNIGRIAYLGRLFPDARFVIPIREPLAHVHSLVKQHRLFTAYAAQDARVPVYLRAAGHYEFGPQRRPINLSTQRPERITDAWQQGHDYRGYAALWADVYGYVWQLSQNRPALAKRLHIVPYETLCQTPREVVAGLLKATGLYDAGAALLDELAHIQAPPAEETTLAEDIRAAVWSEVSEVASKFGYQPPI
jgi:hypothetical protein